MYDPFKNSVTTSWFIHVTSHTVWVLMFALGANGFFVLIPVNGLYAAFVLGFLGPEVRESIILTVISGYVVFSITGIISGLVYSRLVSYDRGGIRWAILSLCAWYALFIGASLSRPVSDYGAMITDKAPDWGSLFADVKIVYLLNDETPVGVPGEPMFITIQRVARSHPKILEVNEKTKDLVYANLSKEAWDMLRNEQGAEYPLVWSRDSDPLNGRAVMLVNMKNDMFIDTYIPEAEFLEKINLMKSVVEKTRVDTPSP